MGRSIQLFDTEENLEAAEPTFEEMPQRLGEEIMSQISGRRVAVERFEVIGARGLANVG